MSFTFVHDEKYRTEDKLKKLKLKLKNTDNTDTKHNQEQTRQNTVNYPGLVAFYDSRSGNEMGLFLQCSRVHTRC